MSLETRIASLVQAIGVDIKSVLSRLSALEGAAQRLRCVATQAHDVYGRTPVDVPEMTVRLAPNTRYAFTFWVVYQTNKTANGASFSLGSSASVRVFAMHRFIPSSDTNNGFGATNVLGEHAPTTKTAEAHADQLAVLTGIVVTGDAGGDLTLQASNETAGSSYLTVLEGSYGQVEVLS